MLLPISGEQRRREMAAGRMAEHQEPLAKTRPQIKTGLAHLFDDLPNRHLRAEIITGERDIDAAPVQSLCYLAEVGRIE